MREPLLPKCLDDLLGFGSRAADARDLAVLLDMLGLLPETGPESSDPLGIDGLPS
ncbi:hypothetical protein [Streptomyces solicathayae]|uniref:Uncharacterized protein n=1 Tax=Streptomyces solicathayae TaxID=3081768 RepID=A0ABZ0LLB8_9ACTN|nr:hypothetical protein [Streptomyces sp. HUAS YS2]WOX20297.1 hypothetical protein R2D22_02385 [Streptomyces sp. HUAS YS2]